MILQIIKKTEKPFKGEDGSSIPYFWYKATRKDTGLSVRFGSTDGEHKEGSEADIMLEEYDQSNGRKGLRELI